MHMMATVKDDVPETIQPSTSTTTQTVLDAKMIAQRFYQTVDTIAAGRASTDALNDVTTTDFQAHLPGQEAVNRDGFKGVVAAFGEGFPAATHSIEDVIAEGDKVVVRLTWRGTHRGMFQGAAATGNNVSMVEMGIVRVADGKVAELWPLFDSLTLLVGAGVVKL